MAMTDMERFIRDYSASIGLNPDVVMQTVLNEGGPSSLQPAGYARQSTQPQSYGQEQSYGPLQLNIRGGVGARALAAGIDPRDPAQAFDAVRFGLNVMAKEGLGQWYGWKGDPWAAHKGGPAASVFADATGAADAVEPPPPTFTSSLADEFSPRRVQAGSSGVRRAPTPNAPPVDSGSGSEPPPVVFASATPEPARQEAPPADAPDSGGGAIPGGLAELFKVGAIGLASSRAVDPKTGAPLLARSRRAYG